MSQMWIFTFHIFIERSVFNFFVGVFNWQKIDFWTPSALRARRNETFWVIFHTCETSFCSLQDVQDETICDVCTGAFWLYIFSVVAQVSPIVSAAERFNFEMGDKTPVLCFLPNYYYYGRGALLWTVLNWGLRSEDDDDIELHVDSCAATRISFAITKAGNS